jgi:hypothetical protein
MSPAPPPRPPRAPAPLHRPRRPPPRTPPRPCHSLLGRRGRGGGERRPLSTSAEASPVGNVGLCWWGAVGADALVAAAGVRRPRGASPFQD